LTKNTTPRCHDRTGANGMSVLYTRHRNSRRLIRHMTQPRGSLHFGTRRVELDGRQGGLYDLPGPRTRYNPWNSTPAVQHPRASPFWRDHSVKATSHLVSESGVIRSPRKHRSSGMACSPSWSWSTYTVGRSLRPSSSI
jgi:hypothetical protein